jgi:hypothetical protein
MIKQLLVALLIGAPLACASTYYVDCNYGSNGNPGTSPQQAWRSLLQVGISSFLPGDAIELRRDCTWNETLTPPSSGSSGSVIKIDSYGGIAAAPDGLSTHRSQMVVAAGKFECMVG